MRRELFELNTPKGTVRIENEAGIGACGDTRNAGYRSYFYHLRPSDFLKLAGGGEAYVKGLPPSTYDYAMAMFVKGMASPVLYVDISLTKPVLKVVGHEGRHRCSALLNVFKYDGLITVLLHAGDNPLPFSLDGWKLEAENGTFQLPLQEEMHFYAANYKFKMADFNDQSTFRNFIQRLPRSLQNIVDVNPRFAELLNDMWRENAPNEWKLDEIFDETTIPMVLTAIERALKP